MKFISLTTFFASSILALPYPKPTTRPSISEAQFADYVRYAKIASSALSTGCKTLYGTTPVAEFSDATTDTQGLVTRDDARKEIIVALRGTSSIQDATTDADVELVPCVGKGIPYPSGSLCHKGFMTSYNSVQEQVINIVTAQRKNHGAYTITVTGHSLGGALASFGALSMRYSFPHVATKSITFGEPRNGNRIYSNFHDSSLRIKGVQSHFRTVHTSDGVPQVVRQGSDGSALATVAGLFLPTNNPSATTGYWHHGVEIWQYQEPPSAVNTVQCVGQEDPTCQNSIFIFAPLLGINEEHLTYFGVSMISTACPAT